MQVRRLARNAIVAAMLAAVSLTAACGGAQQGQTSAPTTVTVAETEGTPSAFVQFGIHNGFFAREGLKVHVSSGAGGAANVPKLMSGQVQFAGSNVVSVLLASTKGLPLKMVASGTSGTDNADHGYQSIMAAGDSDVSSLRELGGKTVAINTLDNIDELLVKTALDRSGVDPDRVKLVEVPFPQMPVSLQQGNVDAVRIIEPFATQATHDDARFLSGGTAATVKPGLQIGSYVTTSRYLSENPDTVRHFVDGTKATAQAIDKDPQEFRDFLAGHAEMPQKLANEIVLPHWKGSVDKASLSRLAELMAKYGISKTKPNVPDVIADLDER